jgi:hypothetical protein
MAVLAGNIGTSVRLADALTGNVDTDTAYVGSRSTTQQGALIITSAIGATPTVTVNIRGSIDGLTFVNIPYAAENTLATAPTWGIAALTITTAKTGFYALQPGIPWRYIKLVLSANTNVTLTVDFLP